MSPSRSRGLKRRETKKSPTSTRSMTATAAALSPENFMEASLSSMMPPTCVTRRMSWTYSGVEVMSIL